MKNSDLKKNKVTVGMTAYNAENFIEASIQSLLKQTLQNFTLIISDDASSDETEQICKKMAEKDSRILYFRQEKNLGPKGNFEFVANQCNTEFFMWASHDDIWASNFLESCLEVLENQIDIGFVITKCIVKSRNIPLVRRCFLPSMKFVSNPDPIKRMLFFTKLSFMTFKDNLTYGVWRNSVLKKIIHDTRNMKYFSIGGAANEYALLTTKGKFIENTYFLKRYKYLPPGSFFSFIFYILLKIKKIKMKQNCYPRYTCEDHINDLVKVLKLAKVDNNTIDTVVELNWNHLPK